MPPGALLTALNHVPVSRDTVSHTFDRLAPVEQDPDHIPDCELVKKQLGFYKVHGAGDTPQIEIELTQWFLLFQTSSVEAVFRETIIRVGTEKRCLVALPLLCKAVTLPDVALNTRQNLTG